MKKRKCLSWTDFIVKRGAVEYLKLVKLVSLFLTSSDNDREREKR